MVKILRSFQRNQIFLDLKKAFDTVNHSLLLKKLENFGIRAQVLSWFSFHISNQEHNVLNGKIEYRKN